MCAHSFLFQKSSQEKMYGNFTWIICMELEKGAKTEIAIETILSAARGWYGGGKGYIS